MKAYLATIDVHPGFDYFLHQAGFPAFFLQKAYFAMIDVHPGFDCFLHQAGFPVFSPVFPNSIIRESMMFSSIFK